MKKLLLLGAFLIVSTSSLFAQEFNLGASAALPLGDAGDLTTFGLNIEANYLTDVSEQFDVGATVGYHHYFGDSMDIPGFGSIDIDDFSFIPVAASARFNASEAFTIGADLGYGIGISPDGNDGGFYYAPKVQYGISETIDIVLAYKGVSLEGGSFDSITLGVEFGL